MKKLSGLWGKFRKLHLGLYLIFSMMVSLGSFTAYFFEKYSLIDIQLLKTEWEQTRNSKDGYRPSEETKDRIFRPLKLSKRVNYVRKDGKWEKTVTYNDKEDVGGLYFLLLIVWLWPLYRHYFSKKPQNPAKIESRIINLPLFIFALVWLMALQRYLAKVWAYSAQYGEVPAKTHMILAVSALVFASFASYLNLELTGLYIRRFIARPFFLETNPSTA